MRARRAAKAGRAAEVDLAQMLRERLPKTVDKTSQAIKSGKLAGADLASSHCLRSNAHSDLGKFAPGAQQRQRSPPALATLAGSLATRGDAQVDRAQVGR
jgi:hypothetical protein